MSAPRTRRATPRSAPSPSFLGQIFSNGKATIAAAVSAGVLALGSAIGNPVRTMVTDRLWPERVSVAQVVHVAEGSPQPLQVVLRSGDGGMSGGVVTLSSADDSVAFTGPTSFAFPRSPGSQSVEPNGGLKVRAKTFGYRIVDVHIATNKGRQFVGKIVVRSSPTTRFENIGTFGGLWEVTLNGRLGRLNLIEKSYRFRGMLELDNGQPLAVVNGWRDGTTFHIEMRGATARSYRVTGVHCHVSYGPERWIVVNARMVTSTDGKPVANPMALGSIDQRCPGFPGILKDSEGDGAFFAAMRVG